ncbi:phenol-soluble modulin export ABC transporter permease subunit PmtB [Staphylococcus canis]|uniref:ABC-2 transporter permease n=1 Tax=Staphylococcus canis TaxID=2724942 RepID=A0ABS0TAH8_9STAP|nr:ABC-2 transporter permease [Staphylococcus canis]MBI5974779.1 hypothetical protein [Staphylococcus canis]
MVQLIKRNLYFRRWTIAIYSIALLLLPIHHFVLHHNMIWVSFILLFIHVIAIIDSAHAYRIYRRLGNREAYIFHHSLPVSRFQLLNAHYITVISLTAFGALLIWSYELKANIVDFNGITFSVLWLFISANLLTFVFGFPGCSEKLNDKIPMTAYIITMLFVVPFTIGVILVTIGIVKFKNPLYFAPIDVGVWYFILSIILAILSYLYQVYRIKKR